MNPIFPSILSSNLFELAGTLQQMADNGVTFIHLDVMDGHFVDNISFGPETAADIKSRFSFAIDAHLMVTNPQRMIPHYARAGADWISFHVEGNEPIDQTIDLVIRHGARPGLVINPNSPVSRLFPFLGRINHVLLMSVFPGHGGQAFIPDTVGRVEELKAEIARQKVPCLIQVDGGLNLKNIASLKRAGTDLFVIGSFLAKAADIGATLRQLKSELKRSET